MSLDSLFSNELDMMYNGTTTVLLERLQDNSLRIRLANTALELDNCEGVPHVYREWVESATSRYLTPRYALGSQFKERITLGHLNNPNELLELANDLGISLNRREVICDPIEIVVDREEPLEVIAIRIIEVIGDYLDYD